MKTVSLSGSPRESVGKKDAINLRRAGKVPCVLYGGDQQISFSVSAIELKKLVYNPAVFRIKLDIEGSGEFFGAIQELQFHPVTDECIHCDFLQLFADRPVRLELPITLVGNSIGVRNGGRMMTPFRKLKIKGLPKDFPDAIEVQVADMKVGDSIRISDLNYPGITFLENPQGVVAAVKTARAVVEEVAVAGEGAAAEGAEEGASAGAEEGEAKKEE